MVVSAALGAATTVAAAWWCALRPTFEPKPSYAVWNAQGMGHVEVRTSTGRVRAMGAIERDVDPYEQEPELGALSQRGVIARVQAETLTAPGTKRGKMTEEFCGWPVACMSSLLIDTPLTTEQREYVETLRTSANNLLTLINDIPDFSKTEAGKKRSSLNATRSRLHGQIDCLPAEDLAVYQKLLDEIVAEYNPVGPTERFHATSAAQSMWRLQRAAALEQGIFATGFREKIDAIDTGIPEVDSSLAASATFLERAKELALLTTYETRIRRALEKDLAALRTLQAERKAAHQRAVDQAAAFTKYAISRREDYEPGDDFKPASAWGGFEFSEPEILRLIDRDIRLKFAVRYHLLGEDLQPKPDFGPKIDMAA